MGQLLVISNTPWFSSTSGSKSTTAFFEAGFSFLEARLQETLRLLIDLLRMIYFLLNAWAFPAFRNLYCNAVFFFLMLTGCKSVSRGMINLKLTLLPSIILKLQAQRGFLSKNMNPQSYKSQYMVLPESNCWYKISFTNGNQHWISRLNEPPLDTFQGEYHMYFQQKWMDGTKLWCCHAQTQLTISDQ